MKTIEEKIKELANRVIQHNYTCNDLCATEYTECQIYKDMLNALSEAVEYQKSIDAVQRVDEVTIKNKAYNYAIVKCRCSRCGGYDHMGMRVCNHSEDKTCERFRSLMEGYIDGANAQLSSL